jgi:hypothetical protein
MLNQRDYQRLYIIKSSSDALYNSIIDNLNSLIKYSNKDKEVFVNLKNKTINLFKTLNSVLPFEAYEISIIDKVFAIQCAFYLEHSFGPSDIAFELSRILDKNSTLIDNYSITYKDYQANIQFCDYLFEQYLKSDKSTNTLNVFLKTIRSLVESFSDKPYLYVEYYERKAKERTL